MGRNFDDLLAARQNSGSPYSYKFFYDLEGQGRVTAHHPTDGIVGGMCWDYYDGAVHGIYVKPEHRNTSVALGMLRVAQKNSGPELHPPSPEVGFGSFTQHGFGLAKHSNEFLEEPQIYRVTPETEKSIVETDLNKYADPTWSIKYGGRIDADSDFD